MLASVRLSGLFYRKRFYIYISIMLLCLVVWLFMQKRILYYFGIACYIYRRNSIKKHCPTVWVILQKKFLYLHQHGFFCLIVWLFMKKKFLYYFVSICYIYRRNSIKKHYPTVWVILQKKFLYLHQYSASLSGCLDYFEEKVFILLYFYMLYLSQEQYELYKIYMIKKSFFIKKLRQSDNL